MGRRSQHGKRAGSFYVEGEELLRRAQCCIVRAAMMTDFRRRGLISDLPSPRGAGTRHDGRRSDCKALSLSR